MPTFSVQTITHIPRLNDCLEYYFCFHTLDNGYLGAFSRIFHEHLSNPHLYKQQMLYLKPANYKGKIILNPLSIDRISKGMKDYYTTCVQQNCHIPYKPIFIQQ